MKKKEYVNLIEKHFNLAKEAHDEYIDRMLFTDNFFGKTKPPTLWQRLMYHIGNFRLWLAKIIAGDRYYDDLV